MTERFVGVQLGPQSVFDEGADHCLGLLQEHAAVNAVLVYTHTYYGTNRKPLATLASDHGLPVRDEMTRSLTRVWVSHHEDRFGGTILRHRHEPEEEYAGRDVLAELAEPARKRGMSVYARILEPFDWLTARYLPNWVKALSVDVYGRVRPLPCWNNPDYQGFWISTFEDLFKSYPLAGIQFGAERVAPISRLLLAGDVPNCFCDHCRARARERGIDVERARQGLQSLYELVKGLEAGGPSPSDGVMVTFLRLLLRYPEALAWEKLQYDSQEGLVKLLYGTVKAINPAAEFGVHVDHQKSTYSLLHRALMDYGEVAHYCDFVKFIAYHDIAGPRIRRWVLDRLSKTLLREVSLPQALELFYDLMGYDKRVEPGLDELDRTGLSPDYVYRLTKRCVSAVGGRAKVYPGIGLDVPWWSDQTVEPFPTDPQKLYSAVVKAFEAGADGIVVSREYNEMRLSNLKAIGRAIRDL